MDQVLLRAEEVAQVLNIGRSKAYELMASGQLPVMRIGRSVRVPAKGFQEWLETRLDATTAEHPQGAVATMKPDGSCGASTQRRRCRRDATKQHLAWRSLPSRPKGSR